MFAIVLPLLVASLAGCSSDSERAADASTVPEMESIPNPNPNAGTPSQAQQDADSHGWGASVQNAGGGKPSSGN
jgi:hypothetical protein